MNYTYIQFGNNKEHYDLARTKYYKTLKAVRNDIVKPEYVTERICNNYKEYNEYLTTFKFQKCTAIIRYWTHTKYVKYYFEDSRFKDINVWASKDSSFYLEDEICINKTNKHWIPVITDNYPDIPDELK